MGGRSIHAGSFVDFNNNIYGTPEDMATAAPMATHGIPRSQFLWGCYQKRVVPHRGLWPKVPSPGGTLVNTYDTYKRVIDLQRASLAHESNTLPLSPDEPHHIPTTKLDLLDEAIRKVFYAQPPIPFKVMVQDTPGKAHDLELHWSVDAAGHPTFLDLKILCPPPQPGAAPLP
jgi:hypothetical protein